MRRSHKERLKYLNTSEDNQASNNHTLLKRIGIFLANLFPRNSLGEGSSIPVTSDRAQYIPNSESSSKSSKKTIPKKAESKGPATNKFSAKFSFKLTSEFKTAFELLELSSNNVFLTGKAGTGKSTFLKYFRDHSSKNLVVVAPTGIAAINIQGVTIHSFFGFPPRVITEDIIGYRKQKSDIYKALQLLIIDEISMVRADLIDGIDFTLRMHRNSKSPFGGVQLLLIGDLYQLPPVIDRDSEVYFRDYYDSPFFFSAKCLQGISIEKIEFTKIFRQSDPKFINLLNEIRLNSITKQSLATLNKKVIQVRPDTGITLTSTNAIANEINKSELSKLRTKSIFYKACVEGDFDKQLFPNEELLELRIGAQVMILRNDRSSPRRWVNGTLGKIVKLNSEFIQVEIQDKVYSIEQEIWENIEYVYNREDKKIESSVIGTFQQFPVKLAWAITIHKSQGKTLEKIHIDMGNGAFAPGQTYVALSRATSLEGVTLATPIERSSIFNSPEVEDYLSQ